MRPASFRCGGGKGTHVRATRTKASPQPAYPAPTRFHFFGNPTPFIFFHTPPFPHLTSLNGKGNGAPIRVGSTTRANPKIYFLWNYILKLGQALAIAKMLSKRSTFMLQVPILITAIVTTLWHFYMLLLYIYTTNMQMWHRPHSIGTLRKSTHVAFGVRSQAFKRCHHHIIK